MFRTPSKATVTFAPAFRVGWSGVMVTEVLPLLCDWESANWLLGLSTSPNALAETLAGSPTWRVGICTGEVPLFENVKLSLMTPYP